MPVSSSFTPASGLLTVSGTNGANAVEINRDTAGNILTDNGAIPVTGGTPTVANTGLIEAFGHGGNDTIRLDETNGALPAAELFGGDGNDALIGGSGNDLLFGQNGNDTLFGEGGGDQMFGGAGSDVLTGGAGNDQVFGQSGNDTMIWNPGDGSDLLEGGDGIDTASINGGDGAETFSISANGTRVLFARTAPDPFTLDIGTTENLVLHANGGDDVITAGNGLAPLIKLTLDGGAGNDTITGGDGNDLLFGGDGNDLVAGGRGNDVAQLGAGDDTFVWNPGDGSDTVDGGPGTDTLLFNGSNVNENIDIAANGSHVRFSRDVGNVTMDLHSIEQIQFNALGGADTITVEDLSGASVEAGYRQPGFAARQRHRRRLGGYRARQRQGRSTTTSRSPAAARIRRTIAGLHGEQVSIQWQRGCQRCGTRHQHSWRPRQDRCIAGLAAGADAPDDRCRRRQRQHHRQPGRRRADRCGAGNDLITGGRGNDVAFMGDGNDKFVWNPGDKVADTVEGQAGADTLGSNGSNANREHRHLGEWHPRPPVPRCRQRGQWISNGVEHIRAQCRRRGRYDHGQRPDRHRHRSWCRSISPRRAPPPAMASPIR